MTYESLAVDVSNVFVRKKEISTAMLRDICPPVWRRMRDNGFQEEEETTINRNIVLQKDDENIIDQS